MRPRILVDCDQVLCDFLGPFARVVGSIWGRDIDLSQMREWNLYDAFEVPAPIKRAADEVLESPGYARTLPMLPGVQRGVQLLREIGDVYVVTAPWHSSRTWREDREWWLKHHLGFVRTQVVPIDDKFLVAGDCLIDDKTKTLRLWAAGHPTGLPIQWFHPSLANATIPSPFIRPDQMSKSHDECWDLAAAMIENHMSKTTDRRWHHG